MEKQFADEKMKKYLRLMRLRRNFVLSVFLVPSVVIVVLMLARVDEKYGRVKLEVRHKPPN
ncbi:Uncharacterised protein [Acinetobacter baumannii]|uniref:hypothetical protein n=1 Tax=Acinetobacter baumannii TaxID=470 RepID=UPI000DE797E0|nr:hypothetical protein [Acinetobacter baumannii]MCJ9203360.1 hypothetical protein [Acinetobacter baumannii]MCJ9354078.1 hypothetical protein [Acinetobacter baumannii]SSP01348.1 Uncharacterised protein [Acinetobacter baumannii]SST82661.1 Uncharacterised protein [Acinetobacter baumannii]SSU15284.1 Uncharacterised protein [Acinetobacter baumannii]